MTNHLLRAAAGLVLLSLPAAAQTVNSECGLRGADTTFSSGVTGKACLEISALNGKTVTIPANVTRIDNTGFALCETSIQSGGAADIVYVMDQSGSMGINYAWIAPDKSDTLYLESLGGNCNMNANDARGHGNITIPNETGVRTIPLLDPAKTPQGCTNTSGDPFTQRGIAFREAIDFQAQRAPQSTAGYMGFANGVLNPIRPLKLNTQANVDRVKANIVLGLIPNTNYTAPLDSAKRWLLNPAISSNPTRAVIFLSDGRPTVDQNRINTVLDANYTGQPGAMPPVYGILLGKPTPDTTSLSDISRLTGGKFFLIPPSQPDSLKAVVAQILNVLLRQFRPVGAVVTNISTAPAGMGIAGAADFTRQNTDSWLFNLNQPVPLVKAQGNQIKVSTQFLDQMGIGRTDSASFILTPSAPDVAINKNLPGTQFSVVCKDLPPPVDPIKKAYIKDTDGDGAGDLVVVVFAQPLASLPVSLDAYWNDFGPAFKNKPPTPLSFLPGTNNTVILADVSASKYPVEATGIPAGAKPVVVLPAGGVFGGQTHPIEDSIGPILVKAYIKPFDAAKLQPGAQPNIDTLTITASEPLHSKSQWDKVIMWSKPVNDKCDDYAHALPVVVAEAPTVDGSSTSITILVDAGSGAPAPSKGDCIYLNVDGTYTDLNFNLPPEHGVIMDGIERPRKVDLFRGYPPVVGLDADKPGFMITNQDPRKGDDFSNYSQLNPKTGQYEVDWFPPVAVNGNIYAIPKMTDPVVVTEIPAPASAMPPGIGTVQVAAVGKYIATIFIYDNRGYYVTDFKQAFGFHGELLNHFRNAPNKGQVSYLVWNLLDKHGRKAGQGVYIWKVLFTFDDGKQEVQYTRTGLMRRTR